MSLVMRARAKISFARAHMSAKPVVVGPIKDQLAEIQKNSLAAVHDLLPAAISAMHKCMRKTMEYACMSCTFDDGCPDPNISKFFQAVKLAWRSGTLTRKDFMAMLAPHFVGIKLCLICMADTTILLYWGPPDFIYDLLYWFTG